MHMHGALGSPSRGFSGRGQLAGGEFECTTLDRCGLGEVSPQWRARTLTAAVAVPLSRGSSASGELTESVP